MYWSCIQWNSTHMMWFSITSTTSSITVSVAYYLKKTKLIIWYWVLLLLLTTTINYWISKLLVFGLKVIVKKTFSRGSSSLWVWITCRVDYLRWQQFILFSSCVCNKTNILIMWFFSPLFFLLLSILGFVVVDGCGVFCVYMYVCVWESLCVWIFHFQQWITCT